MPLPNPSRGLAVSQGRGAPIYRTQTVPAPVGGLNAVDSIAAMPATDAIVLDNWVPQTTYCSLRAGYEQWGTGLGHWAETLMGYSDLTTTEELFTISGGNIYDVTAQGAVGAPVVTGLTNSRWESVNVATPGGAYLYAANATDPPLLYDGTNWASITGSGSPAITNVTTTTLRNPAVWKSRVWFIQDNTNLAWYLPVQSIGGAANSVDLSTIFTKGGNLRSILTFSVASATSFDDYIGFLSSEGQLAVYTGTDPDTPGLFVITGVYDVGKPIGRRCWFKYGADAIILSANGFVSVSKSIAVGIQEPTNAISYKILALVNANVQQYGTNFGWEGVVYPLGNKIIINVPQNTNSRQHQYVMNTINNSWCSYGVLNTPWNAATFCVLGNDIYWGGNGFVAKAEIGTADNGGQVLGTVQPAYNYFGSDRNKHFTLIRPMIQTNGTIQPAMSLCLNFNTIQPTNFPTFSNVTLSLWNIALWNVSYWSTGPVVQTNWQTVGGVGFSATIYLAINSNQATVNLLSVDYLMCDGGIL